MSKINSQKRFRKSVSALGLMSGSSLDGLDMAYCEFDISSQNGFPQVISWSMGKSATASYTRAWVNRLKTAPSLDGLKLMQLHTDYGLYVGQLVKEFVQKNALTPDLVASHGHTVFHYPDLGFTLQIGDGAAIAQQTGLATICNFRNEDVAAGGQGAPLAPLADLLLLDEHDFYLNLGGIANLTAKTPNTCIAFDIGGANQMLNALVAELDLPYDDKGQIARTGHYIPKLAQQQDQLPYFAQPYPKSLGNNWVQEQQTAKFLDYPAPLADKLHTACHHIARQITKQIDKIIAEEKFVKTSYSMLVSGGGVYNDFLMECIAAALPEVAIEIPSDEIIAFKEAALMALMGSLRLLELPNCLASVTGANKNVCGGAIHSTDGLMI